jgi:hypothetical protein
MILCPVVSSLYSDGGGTQYLDQLLLKFHAMASGGVGKIKLKASLAIRNVEAEGIITLVAGDQFIH